MPTLVHAWRWARRHPAVSLLAAGLILALVLGTCISLSFANVAFNEAKKQRLAREQADRARNEAQDVADFILTDMFGRATPHRDGADLKVVDVLDQAAANAKQRFSDQPQRLINVLKLIGDAYANLSQVKKAAEVSEQLVELQNGVAGPEDRITMQYQSSLAGRLRWHDLQRAESLLRSNLTKQRRILGSEDIDTLFTTSVLGDVLQMRGQHDEARKLLSTAIECYRSGIRDKSGSHYPGALSYLVASYMAKGDLDNALSTLEEWQELNNGKSLNHPSSLAMQHVHGRILANKGRHEEAIPVYQRAIQSAGSAYQEDDQRIAMLQMGLARSLRYSGKLAESMRVGAAGYESLRSKLGYNDYTVEKGVSHVIATAVALGDREKELEYRRDALLCRLHIAGPEQEDGIMTRFDEYIQLLRELHGDGAMSEFRADFSRHGEEISPTDYRRGHFLSNWGWIQWQQNDAKENHATIAQSLIDGYEHIEAHFNEAEAKPWARKRVADFFRSIGRDEKAAKYDVPSSDS